MCIPVSTCVLGGSKGLTLQSWPTVSATMGPYRPGARMFKGRPWLAAYWTFSFWGEKKSSKINQCPELSKRNAAAQETVVTWQINARTLVRWCCLLKYEGITSQCHGQPGPNACKFKNVVVMKMKAILHWTTPGTLGRAPFSCESSPHHYHHWNVGSGHPQ